MEKALAWQTIKAEDVTTLQTYSLFFRGCYNVIEELQYMEERACKHESHCVEISIQNVGGT